MEDCTSLETVEFKDEITAINNDTFENRKQLKSVLIPRVVNYVENAAFGVCENLYEVIFNGVEPPFYIGEPFQRHQFTMPIKSSLKKLIERCWSNDPEERPNFGEIIDWCQILISELYFLYNSIKNFFIYFLYNMSKN